MKVYKALRVLERNKSKETPNFSKAIEKLIRYFSKAFPENCGLEGNLNDLNMSSHGQSTASNFYRSSTVHSEFSDFEDFKEFTKMSASDGKQGGSNINFKLLDCKTSNDSNSVKGGSESRTELIDGKNQRRMSNDNGRSPQSKSNNVSSYGLEN